MFGEGGILLFLGAEGGYFVDICGSKIVIVSQVSLKRFNYINESTRGDKKVESGSKLGVTPKHRPKHALTRPITPQHDKQQLLTLLTL